MGSTGKSTTTITDNLAENLTKGTVISPKDEKWTIHLPNGDKMSGQVNDYITIDSVKVGPKTVKIEGHYDLSGQYRIGTKEYEEAKKRLVKVTKSVKKGTNFKIKQ